MSMNGLYGLLMILFSSYQVTDFVIDRCTKPNGEVQVFGAEELITKSATAQSLINKNYKDFQGACIQESIDMETLINLVWNFEKYSVWEHTVTQATILSQDQTKAEVKLDLKYTMKNGKTVLLNSRLIFEKKIISDTEVHIAWQLSENDDKKSFDIHEGVWYFIKRAEDETFVFHFTRLNLNGFIRNFLNERLRREQLKRH